MKKLLLLSITGMFLMSCGGGWSEDDQQAFLNDCPGDACECYLKASEKKFDDYAEFQDAFGQEEHMEWAEEVEEKCEG